MDFNPYVGIEPCTVVVVNTETDTARECGEQASIAVTIDGERITLCPYHAQRQLLLMSVPS